MFRVLGSRGLGFGGFRGLKFRVWQGNGLFAQAVTRPLKKMNPMQQLGAQWFRGSGF